MMTAPSHRRPPTTRATLVALLVLSLTATAATVALPGCANDSGRAPVGTGGASAGTGGTSGGSCRVSISPITPSDLTTWRAGPSAIVRLRATVPDGRPGAAATWRWSARFADGSALATTTALGDPALIDVPTTAPGSYFIQADLEPSPYPCHGVLGFTVKAVGAAVASFRFRVTPPASAGEPTQVLGPLLVTGRTPSDQNNLPLAPTTAISLFPQRAEDGQGLAAYVRTEETSTGLVQEGHADGFAPVVLRLAAGHYRVLVVPDESDRAPWLSPETELAQLATLPLAVDRGSPLVGRVLDQAGQPVPKVAVALRAGAMPSTLARTDAQGNYALRVRPGKHAVSLAQDDGALHWEGTIVAGAMLEAGDMSGARLDVRVRLGTRRALSLTAAGARTPARAVVVAPTLADGFVAATLVTDAHPAPATRSGTGLARAQAAFAGAPSQATLVGLPPAVYEATLLPGAADQAVTSLASLDATAADVSATVTMKGPVTLSGAWNGAGAASGTMVAIDDDASAWWNDGVSPTATGAVSQGRWALQVNPLRRYRLIAVPQLPAGADNGVTRVVMPSVNVAAVDLTVPALELPARVLFGGRVVDPLLTAVGGALVQAFCLEGAPGCADATVPLAEATTYSDGRFSLYLPDPGLLDASQP